VWIAVLWALVAVGVLGAVMWAAPAPAVPGFHSVVVAPGGGRGTYATPPPPPAGAEIVSVGIEPVQVYAVNLGAGTWSANFFVWWRWRGPIDPTATTTITNVTAATTNLTKAFSYVDTSGNERPVRLSDGEWYQQAYISSGMSDTFPLGNFPLDSQSLQIRFENGTYDYRKLVYVIDRGHISRDPGISVPGWNTSGVTYAAYVHHYDTDFGSSDSRTKNSTYSDFVMSIHITRPVSHFLVKLLLPLIIVLFAAIGALMVPARLFEPRLAIAATGLLTLIFLQQGYSGDLPSPVPVVLMDVLYAVALIAVFITFARTVWTSAKVRDMDSSPGMAESLRRTDHRLAITLGVVAPLGMLLAYLLYR
jgi:hypothetical protein